MCRSRRGISSFGGIQLRMYLWYSETTLFFYSMTYQNPKPVVVVNFRNPEGTMYLRNSNGEGFGSTVVGDTFEGTATKMAFADLHIGIDAEKLVFTDTHFVPGDDPRVVHHFDYTLSPVNILQLPPEFEWGSSAPMSYTSSYAASSMEKTIPVAVGIIEHPDNASILIGERGIEPAIGRRALFGGYTELETLEEAVSREIVEEAGVRMSCKPVYVGSALGHGSRLLVFYRMRATRDEVPSFAPSSEMRALHWEDSKSIMDSPLGFPLHQEFALRALTLRALELSQPEDTPNF